MLPSDAIKEIFNCLNNLRTQPYNKIENRDKLEKAYRDFDEAIESSLLELIRNSDKDDKDHHSHLVQPWVNDPDYKQALHQYDHIFDQTNKETDNDQ